MLLYPLYCYVGNELLISWVDVRRSVAVNQAGGYKSLDRDCGSDSGEKRIHLNDTKGRVDEMDYEQKCNLIGYL